MKDPIDKKHIALVCDILLNGEYRSAIKYVSPRLVVKATWQQKPTKRDRGNTILVTIGQPNYLERKFIKLCQKANVPFPVRNVQLKYYPKKK